MLSACFPLIRFMGKKHRFIAPDRASDHSSPGISAQYANKKSRPNESLNPSVSLPQDILEIRNQYQIRGRYKRQELAILEEYERNRHFQNNEDTPLLNASVENLMKSFDAKHLTQLPRLPFKPEHFEDALPLR